MKKIILAAVIFFGAIVAAESSEMYKFRQMIGYTVLRVETLKDITKSNDMMTVYFHFQSGLVVKSTDMSAQLLLCLPMTEAVIFGKNATVTVKKRLMKFMSYKMLIDGHIIDLNTY